MRQGVLRTFGKGNKERLVPLGEEALHWLQRYQRDARDQLLAGRPSDVLFPSQRGEQMTRQTFWHRISCTPGAQVSRPAFRPTPCATHSQRTC